jgi:hypothetical protein
MNLGTTLWCLPAFVKKQESHFQWAGFSSTMEIDLGCYVDARVLAEHLIWASTTAVARNEHSTWSMEFLKWFEQIMESFGIEAIGF